MAETGVGRQLGAAGAEFRHDREAQGPHTISLTQALPRKQARCAFRHRPRRWPRSVCSRPLVNDSCIPPLLRLADQPVRKLVAIEVRDPFDRIGGAVFGRRHREGFVDVAEVEMEAGQLVGIVFADRARIDRHTQRLGVEPVRLAHADGPERCFDGGLAARIAFASRARCPAMNRPVVTRAAMPRTPRIRTVSIMPAKAPPRRLISRHGCSVLEGIRTSPPESSNFGGRAPRYIQTVSPRALLAFEILTAVEHGGYASDLLAARAAPLDLA